MIDYIIGENNDENTVFIKTKEHELMDDAKTSEDSLVIKYLK